LKRVNCLFVEKRKLSLIEELVAIAYHRLPWNVDDGMVSMRSE